MNLQNQSKHPQMFNHVSKEDKSLAMIMWVLTFFTSFVAPLVIWLVKKKNQNTSISREKLSKFRY